MSGLSELEAINTIKNEKNLYTFISLLIINFFAQKGVKKHIRK
jgi:hypothetical protein